MPTNRTAISRDHKVSITPEILALYCAALADCSLENRAALHAALGRKVWQECVMDCDDDNEPPDNVLKHGPDRIQDWRNARALWVRLDAAHRGSR